VKKEAASPRRRPLCIKEETSRQPILKTLFPDGAKLLGAGTLQIKEPTRARWVIFRDQKRRGGADRAGPPRPGAPAGIVRGFIGNRPSRCNFLRASLRARRMASAFSRTLLSEGFS
jgi:hypothetical protein